MIGLNNLKPAGPSRKRKRVGRGLGSRYGRRAGRGNKGQGSRSGEGRGGSFEGGQNPLVRRLPKHGFTNIFRVEYKEVNLSALSRFEAGSVVDPTSLKAARIIKGKNPMVKILGKGEIDRALTVKAHKFSKKAAEKIASVGGVAEVIE